MGFASVVNCTLDIGDNAWVYKQVVALKNREPKLKIMISAGGNTELHDGFSEMVKNHANRKRCVPSTFQICIVLCVRYILYKSIYHLFSLDLYNQY